MKEADCDLIVEAIKKRTIQRNALRAAFKSQAVIEAAGGRFESGYW
ncbi:MAG: hypothetical protein R2805_06400 [Flavobacterium sp.]